MYTLVAQGICCCFACCCKDISNALKRWLGPQKVTKIFYLFLVIVFTLPSIVILFYLNEWKGFMNYFSWLKCPQQSGQGLDCIGPSAIYRISLSFLILFGLMMLINMLRNRLAMVINQGLFCIKYILVLGIFIAFLFAKNQSFITYSNVSKYISILFMIIQSIILIDLFYLAGIKLVARYDSGQNCCAGVLIFLTIVFQGIAIALNVLGYILFSKDDSCGNSIWVNGLNSALLVLLPCSQLFNFNKQNSLLTTALVSMYVSYLALVCQFSYGGANCNLCYITGSGRMTIASLAADIIVSTLFFVLTMYGTIMGGSGAVKITQKTDLGQAIGASPASASTQNEQNQKSIQKPIIKQPASSDSPAIQNDEVNLLVYTTTWQWVKWHFYMCLASIYVGMLITNWTSASITTGVLISNDFGFWVRVIISWCTALLYLWTLVAPRVFPNRDFTVV